ncbi:MAG: hypothetical protein KDD44_06160, partial [Bdellovibrionales bacterium]|nr:hypothetical protein [Bdellovibrionales bacterium]
MNLQDSAFLHEFGRGEDERGGALLLLLIITQSALLAIMLLIQRVLSHEQLAVQQYRNSVRQRAEASSSVVSQMRA